MYFLDVFGDDFRHLDRALEEERRHGPCEDDYEVTAPYIGMLPEESDHEDGSPLDFSSHEPIGEDPRFIDAVLMHAFRQGVT